MLQKILDPRILIWKSILLANLILASTLLFAQAPSQSSTITLDEVALNAPKLKTVRVLVPSSVSILNLIPQQEVQQQLSLQEYLRGIPGLFSSNASNYAQG
jgi:iron complex outermembrane receptor protein